MKWIVLIPILLLLLDLSPGSEESDELRVILDQTITPGELRDDWLAENIKPWPGLKTIAGVAALYDIQTNTRNGDELLACAYIEKQLQVPRDEIVTYLLKRPKECKFEDLLKNLSCLEPYSDDPRVRKCYAFYLDDKRQVYQMRGTESVAAGRICDYALGCLLRWLQDTKILQWGTPGFVWDSPSSEDRDRNIIAIRPYLIKTGVIEEGKQSDASASSHQRKPMESGTTGKTRPDRRGAHEDRESITHGEINHATSVWVLAAWGSAALFALGLLWVFLKKRRNVSRPGQ